MRYRLKRELYKNGMKYTLKVGENLLRNPSPHIVKQITLPIELKDWFMKRGGKVYFKQEYGVWYLCSDEDGKGYKINPRNNQCNCPVGFYSGIISLVYMWGSDEIRVIKEDVL